MKCQTRYPFTPFEKREHTPLPNGPEPIPYPTHDKCPPHWHCHLLRPCHKTAISIQSMPFRFDKQQEFLSLVQGRAVASLDSLSKSVSFFLESSLHVSGKEEEGRSYVRIYPFSPTQEGLNECGILFRYPFRNIYITWDIVLVGQVGTHLATPKGDRTVLDLPEVERFGGKLSQPLRRNVDLNEVRMWKSISKHKTFLRGKWRKLFGLVKVRFFLFWLGQLPKFNIINFVREIFQWFRRFKTLVIHTVKQNEYANTIKSWELLPIFHYTLRSDVLFLLCLFHFRYKPPSLVHRVYIQLQLFPSLKVT